MKIKIIIILSLIVFYGCFTTQNTSDAIRAAMDSWLDHHQSELIRSCGPPTETADDGSGGKVLIYKDYVNLGTTEGRYYYQNDGIYTPQGQSGNGEIMYDPPKQRGYWVIRMFYVNQSGIIYHWRTDGQ